MSYVWNAVNYVVSGSRSEVLLFSCFCDTMGSNRNKKKSKVRNVVFQEGKDREMGPA